MDNFDNFFDDGDNKEPIKQYTPVYHTPDQAPPPAPPKKNTALIISVIVSIIMCLAIVINVIVIAALKDTIASDYAAKMEESIRSQYTQAIQDELDKTDVVDKIIDEASQNATDKLNTPIGEIGARYLSSVAVLQSLYKNGLGEATDGSQGTAFILGYSGNTGYLLTNAHIAKFEKQIGASGDGIITQVQYKFEYYNDFTAVFSNGTKKKLSILNQNGRNAVGDYFSENISGSGQTFPDIAILTFAADSSFQTEHPALKLYADNDSVKLGSAAAVLGNAKGLGLSVTSGSVSAVGVQFALYSPSTVYHMTDAAVNNGNSGGPMIDKNGVVTGVCSMGFSPSYAEDMSFFISTETVLNFIATVRSNLQISVPCTAV